MISRAVVAKIAYNRNPAVFLDRVDGECRMPWNQALFEKPQELTYAFDKADRILLSSTPEKDLAMFAGMDEILDTMGSFTWMFGRDWFIETQYGNFHWSDPKYNGDNSFKLFNGTSDEFYRHLGVPHGVAKGRHLVRKMCGDGITMVIPAE